MRRKKSRAASMALSIVTTVSMATLAGCGGDDDAAAEPASDAAVGGFCARALALNEVLAQDSTPDRQALAEMKALLSAEDAPSALLDDAHRVDQALTDVLDAAAPGPNGQPDVATLTSASERLDAASERFAEDLAKACPSPGSS